MSVDGSCNLSVITAVLLIRLEVALSHPLTCASGPLRTFGLGSTLLRLRPDPLSKKVRSCDPLDVVDRRLPKRPEVIIDRNRRASTKNLCTELPGPRDRIFNWHCLLVFLERRPSVGSLDIPNNGKARPQPSSCPRTWPHRATPCRAQRDKCIQAAAADRQELHAEGGEDADPALGAELDLSKARAELLSVSSTRWRSFLRSATTELGESTWRPMGLSNHLELGLKGPPQL